MPKRKTIDEAVAKKIQVRLKAAAYGTTPKKVSEGARGGTVRAVPHAGLLPFSTRRLDVCVCVRSARGARGDGGLRTFPRRRPAVQAIRQVRRRQPGREGAAARAAARPEDHAGGAERRRHRRTGRGARRRRLDEPLDRRARRLRRAWHRDLLLGSVRRRGAGAGARREPGARVPGGDERPEPSAGAAAARRRDRLEGPADRRDLGPERPAAQLARADGSRDREHARDARRQGPRAAEAAAHARQARARALAAARRAVAVRGEGPGDGGELEAEREPAPVARGDRGEGARARPRERRAQGRAQATDVLRGEARDEGDERARAHQVRPHRREAPRGRARGAARRALELARCVDDARRADRARGTLVRRHDVSVA